MSTTAAGRPATTSPDGFVTVPPGLAKVVVTDTELGDVRGEEGFYHYRQYSAVDLAEQVSFEEAAHLLLVGHLPDADELARLREPSWGGVACCRLGSPRCCPRSAARRATRCRCCARRSRHGEASPTSAPSTTPARRSACEAVLSAVAVTPTILAAAHRLQRGLEPDRSRPVARSRRRLPAHGDRASSRPRTRPARSRAISSRPWTTASTPRPSRRGSSRARAPTSRPASSGRSAPSPGRSTAARRAGPSRRSTRSAHSTAPRHGCGERVEAGDRIMGFGHAVYRTRDPRSEMLKGSRAAGTTRSSTSPSGSRTPWSRPWPSSSPGRELHANVEFYAGVVMKLAGLHPSMFTPTFCVARVVGWGANVLEQARDPKIIRPAARYVGPPPPSPPRAGRDGR